MLGIVFILLAFVLKLSGLPTPYFYSSLTIGIVFKTLFLIKGLRNGRIKFGFPLYLLFGGLVLLGISMGLKYGLGWIDTAKWILYLALLLKTSAVILFISSQHKKKDV